MIGSRGRSRSRKRSRSKTRSKSRSRSRSRSRNRSNKEPEYEAGPPCVDCKLHCTVFQIWSRCKGEEM